MKPPFVRLGCLAIAGLSFALCRAADENALEPDSMPQPGVPRGEVLKFSYLSSGRIYPGTVRDYWVYVPAEYTGNAPACLYVGQDSVQDRAPIVFDNLIWRHEMPVTIGVWIAPGKVPAAHPKTALDRYDRSYEYDGLAAAYVRFLETELLPDVERRHAADGRPIRLSRRASDRAIGGESSGAIAAFTAAWERPDLFSRVFSSIGTYVGLRGGDVYPGLIRKYEPKPIRVFLQDGSNDHNAYGGDWWMANQTMERALEFAGYEVNHVWGTGGHNGKQAAAVFPEAMRWLWQGWPEPVPAGQSKNAFLEQILVPGAGWELAGQGFRSTDGPAADANGVLYFDGSGRIYRTDGGPAQAVVSDGRRRAGEAFAPDGRLYRIENSDSVVASVPGQPGSVVATGIDKGNDLVVARNGNIYVTSDPPRDRPTAPSIVWLIRPDGSKGPVDSGLKFANGIALSPDQALLYVDDMRTHWVYSYVIAPDGTLGDRQRYFRLYQPDDADDSGADGMRVDRDGRLYVSTRLGIQICDQAGRVNAIIPTPNGRVSNLCFAGPDFRTLYATCGDRVYRRQLKVAGANAWAPPLRPAPPHL